MFTSLRCWRSGRARLGRLPRRMPATINSEPILGRPVPPISRILDWSGLFLGIRRGEPSSGRMMPWSSPRPSLPWNLDSKSSIASEKPLKVSVNLFREKRQQNLVSIVGPAHSSFGSLRWQLSPLALQHRPRLRASLGDRNWSKFFPLANKVGVRLVEN